MFILGNGASIASANEDLKDAIGVLSMETAEKFVDVMSNMTKDNCDARNKLMERCPDFAKFEKVFIIKRYIADKLRQIIKKKKVRTISKLLEIQSPTKGKIKDPEYSFVFSDYWIKEEIFKTVAGYYEYFEPKYLRRLWEVVERTKSPVVSLNWDINLERVIHECKKVDMCHYYGKSIFDNLNHTTAGHSFNPIVTILKPHGSMNWHFIENEKAREFTGDGANVYGGILPIDCYHLNVVSNIVKLWNVGCRGDFLIPPEDERKKKTNFWDPYMCRTEILRESISQNITYLASTSRVLVIIGYSFPYDDAHILSLFQKNQFEEIWVFDKNPDVFSKICNFFPRSKSRFFANGFSDILNVDASVWAG